MALSNTTADAVATAICTALSIVDVPSQTVWKTIIRKIYAGLKTDVDITIAATSIVTTGSATTQSGPATPITLHPG